MKKYRWVLTAVFAAFLVGTSGCGKKTETIPITTISQSTDDDDPEDNLAASGDSDEIPEYDVDLSKNLNSFQLAIWGDTYEIPESYADFTALGWVYSGDDTKEIQPESFSEGEIFEKDGNQITVDIANPDTTAKPVAECLIGGIHIDTSTAEGQNIYVGLPNGVTLQQSLMEDVESIYGAPKDRYEADTSVQFTYEYGLYQTITLGFDNETGILYSLDMQNFTTTAIWGDTYEIPESYADFTALGWVYSGDDTKEIQPESFSEGEIFEKDGNQITVDIANPDTTAKPVAECLIGGIHIDTSTAEGQNIYVGLPNGVTLQQSLMEDVESIYGAPKDRYEADTSVQFTYEYGLYQTITLGFDNETGILYSLDMQNFTTTADAEALDGVSDATTPEVEAYQAPEADSSEINDWTVRFDDVLYHLPVPVSELLDHDWTINTKESDTAVLNGKYGYVTLEKGGQKLYCTVHNYGAEATTVRNCFVTSLYGDLDTTKIPISITNGITLGTSESDFLAKAGDAKSEKTEKENSNLTLYTFYSDDEKLDYTEIGIDNDLKLVRSIKVVHNQPEAPEEEAKKTSAEDSSSVSDSQEPSETPAP